MIKMDIFLEDMLNEYYFYLWELPFPYINDLMINEIVNELSRGYGPGYHYIFGARFDEFEIYLQASDTSDDSLEKIRVVKKVNEEIKNTKVLQELGEINIKEFLLKYAAEL